MSSDTVKVRGDWHAENLASGRVVAPGEVFDRSALDLEQPGDRRLINEGVVIDAVVTPVELQGDALQERARQLGIRDRSKLSAGELRQRVAQAEAEQPQAAEDRQVPQRLGGGA